MTEMLDISPALPIHIQLFTNDPESSRASNVVTALDSEHHAHIRGIRLFDIPSLLWERLSAVMQKPFPELTRLDISLGDGARAIPDSFLAGSAPRLRELYLTNTPLPAMHKLLLSSSDLVQLLLSDIPHSGYIPPEAVATCLSVLPRLEQFHLQFRSHLSRPDPTNRRPPPLTPRAIVPSLTTLDFSGASDYLEDLVARIDTSQLDHVVVTFLNQLMFDTPQLSQFFIRTEELMVHKEAYLVFDYLSVEVRLPQAETVYLSPLVLRILCRHSEWQLSALAQVCGSSFPYHSTLEHLHVGDTSSSPDRWPGDIETAQWVELLSPFTALKNLYLSRRMASRIADTLEELAGQGITEVLPALQNIFLQGLQSSGPVQDAVGQFVTARQRSGFPVAVHSWEGESGLW